ncbi:hypothetical protein NDU88_006147, partial [Pleurodeles waltl]
GVVMSRLHNSFQSRKSGSIVCCASLFAFLRMLIVTVPIKRRRTCVLLPHR